MNHNIIREYNEITNKGVVTPDRYIQKIIQLVTDEDREQCIRFITVYNKLEDLCRGDISKEYINYMAEESDYFLFFHDEKGIHNIVGFAFIKIRHKKRGRILAVELLCTMRNTKRFGQMLAYALYVFAITKKCSFIYASPRTPKLQETFINYGFDHVFSIRDDIVLEKEVLSGFMINTNRSFTRKQKTHSSKSKGRLVYNKSQVPLELE